MFRRFRILILLLTLLGVIVSTQLDRLYIARWNVPLVVAIFPINADGSEVSTNYIASLTAKDFVGLETFFDEEASAHKVALRNPIRIALAPPLDAIPPKPPVGDPSVLKVMAWSLHLRWWAWRTPPKPPGVTPRVRLFLLFHSPLTHAVLDHSTGLEKGRIGVVNLFASPNAVGSNQVVIAHELLHTVGASDKYDPTTTLPAYPEGYAEPFTEPRFPQRYAEVMGGRVPLSPTTAAIPDSLSHVMVGAWTAAEIGWRKTPP
jgi:hypothetical protein